MKTLQILRPHKSENANAEESACQPQAYQTSYVLRKWISHGTQNKKK